MRNINADGIPPAPRTPPIYERNDTITHSI